MNNYKKLKKIIPTSEHKKLALLVLLLFVGMFFEVLGIGILLPILTAVLDPEILLKNQLSSSVLDIFQITDKELIVKIALGTLLVVYFVKSAFLIFLSHFQNKFISNLSAFLSNKLFSNYLNQGYKFHVDRNSSELIKNFQVEITYFSNFLVSTISLFTEVALAFSVIITLLFIEPFGTLVVMLFFGVSSFLFYQFTKKRTTRWGKVREQIDGKISKTVLETLTGIKEVILLGKQSFFKQQLEKSNTTKALIASKALTLRQIPRYYLELLSVFSLIFFIFIMLVQNKNVDNVIVTLGVFVAATFRILPSINRILGSLQNIKFYKSSIDLLYNEFDVPLNERIVSRPTNSPREPIKSISVYNVSFSYEGTSELILDKVTFELEAGSTTGIIGVSGSGKSTLINIIVGLFQPTNGEILIDNEVDILKDLMSWQEAIGYVSQDVFLSDESILLNIAFGMNIDEIDHEQINKVLKQAQLTDLIESLPEGYNTKVGERGVQLSGGQRQRIGIARALYRKPDILVLDEATSALDVKTEQDIMTSIDDLKGQLTIIIVTHRLITLKNCDDIYSVKKGKITKEQNLIISEYVKS
ncbi:ABC transporter ATP-binding protein/permease [Flavobacteriaceae bacterium]|nr:ABC transporter ATP-binding protein/permease [Flavobacteriaceae bacterium]